MEKKVFHIITSFEKVGGAEKALTRVVNASGGDTHHTIVSLMNVSDLMKGQLNNAVKLYSLKADGAFGLLLTVLKLRKILKSSNPDVVYSWMYHANFVAALTKLLLPNSAPLVFGVRHSLDDFKGEKISTKLAIYAGRVLRFVPKYVVYCSSRALKQHVTFGYSSQSNSIYIPNGYTFTDFSPRLFKKESIVLGAAGRFSEAKDYKTLFKSMASILNKYPHIRLRIAGRDVDNANQVIDGYLEIFKIDSSQIDLLGHLTDMTAFYNSVDFFVLSSKTEGFPNVLAEAAACGCITFSTDVGDARLIVNNKDRIVKVGDAPALTKILDCYINKSSNELKAIAHNSSNYIRETYTIEVASKKLFNLQGI